jgi:hypothetical protein
VNKVYLYQFFIFLWFSFGNLTQIKTQTISPKILVSGFQLDSIQSEVYWKIDKTQMWTIDTLRNLTLHSFDFTKGVPFNPYYNFWFTFSFKNQSKTDSIDALLCIGDYTTIHLYTFEI